MLLESLNFPLSLLDMWKVDWLSWRPGLYSGTKFASFEAIIFFENFEVKLATGALNFRPKTDIAIGAQKVHGST